MADEVERALSMNHLTSLHINELDCVSWVANEFLDFMCSFDLPEKVCRQSGLQSADQTEVVTVVAATHSRKMFHNPIYRLFVSYNRTDNSIMLSNPDQVLHDSCSQATDMGIALSLSSCGWSLNPQVSL